ncbi:MAG: 23S rRNA (uracil(1939)-C(5))-methyltransferase RlmD [Acidobacteria bacterium]|nr:23S rRNA (uracil(1939)-C(5))-methyltransferase RlmD [Acidobacteriota bacterium]
MADIRTRIDRIAYGGAGVGHYEDASVFVPFTLSGEEVNVRLEREKSGRWDASLLNIMQPSSDRVAPECIHFGVCGGCHYQHAVYPAQLRIKQQILRDTLQRGGVTPPAEIATHSAEPYHYRNRIQLRLERVEGQWRVGYSERASHRFMPAIMCPISAETLWSTAEAMQTLLGEGHVLGKQPLCEAEIFCNADGSQVQLSIYLDIAHATMDRDAPAHFRGLCEALRQHCPQLSGAGLWVWSAEEKHTRDNRAQHRTSLEVATWGERLLRYEVPSATGTHTYEIARGGFFQVNRWMLPQLIDLVTANRSGNSAWDLFAGVGLFSESLVRSFRSVTAVEIGERSFASLSGRFRTFGKPHTAQHKDTLAFLREDARRLPVPDLIIVDPPRAGLGEPTCRELARVQTKELVYVSCDPTTLSRDLKWLIESGYRLTELHLLDLFPQTFHMESVAKLTRV